MLALVLLLSRFAVGLVPCADSVVAAADGACLRQRPGVALPRSGGGGHCLPAERQLPGACGGRAGSAALALSAAVGQLAAIAQWPGAAGLSGSAGIAWPRGSVVLLLVGG